MIARFNPSIRRSSPIGLILASLFSLVAQAAWAQGPLAPSAGPGPTFRTLQQIEARTPITNTTAITISQRGSYYLTTNITVATGNAITIDANGVTLDLNGFTISSTAASPNGSGIQIGSFRRNITIFNGFIEGGVTQSGGIFSGTGFLHGINYDPSQPENIEVSRVAVSGVMLHGIFLGGGEATFVDSCRVYVAGGDGIRASGARNCVVRDAGFDGVRASTVENCSGRVTGAGYGILADSAINCQGTSSAGGIGVQADTMTNCRGMSIGTGGYGIFGVNATGCWGFADVGHGISVVTALNCQGTSNGNGYGIIARSVLNCYGRSAGNGGGISSDHAQNSAGESGGSGVGLYGDFSNNCWGQSASGWGLSATIATACGGSGTPGLVTTYKYNMPGCPSCP